MSRISLNTGIFYYEYNQERQFKCEYYLVVTFSNPTYQDEPIAGFGPVQCFDINVLNITNHGLEIDINPRKLEVEFWDDLNRQVEKMAMKNRYRY